MADFSERYQLRVPLGETEVGAVWEALDNESNRSVVVVVLEDDAPEDLKAHFEKTYEALSAIDSPHIVKVLDRGTTDDGGPYAAIEKLDGRPLIAFMDDADAKASIREAVEWLMGALEGLEAAHGAGIAHGDMEPGNVFLADVDGNKVPKIIGWGLNRAFVRAGLHEPEDPEAESLLRSLAFAPPEQSNAKRGPEATDDLYGVAAILYDALTGELPHHGTSVDEIRESLKSAKVVSTQKLRREVAGTMAALVDRCLQGEVKRRPTSAQALHRSLKSALSFSSRIAELDLAPGRRSLTPSEELLEEKAKALEASSAAFAVPTPAGGGLSAKRASPIAQTTPGIGAPPAAVSPPSAKLPREESPEEAEPAEAAPAEAETEAKAAETSEAEAKSEATAPETTTPAEPKAKGLPKPKAPLKVPKAPPKPVAFPVAAKKPAASAASDEEETAGDEESKRPSEEPGRISLADVEEIEASPAPKSKAPPPPKSMPPPVPAKSAPPPPPPAALSAAATDDEEEGAEAAAAQDDPFLAPVVPDAADEPLEPTIPTARPNVKLIGAGIGGALALVLFLVFVTSGDDDDETPVGEAPSYEVAPEEDESETLAAEEAAAEEEAAAAAAAEAEAAEAEALAAEEAEAEAEAEEAEAEAEEAEALAAEEAEALAAEEAEEEASEPVAAVTTPPVMRTRPAAMRRSVSRMRTAAMMRTAMMRPRVISDPGF